MININNKFEVAAPPWMLAIFGALLGVSAPAWIGFLIIAVLTELNLKGRLGATMLQFTSFLIPMSLGMVITVAQTVLELFMRVSLWP